MPSKLQPRVLCVDEDQDSREMLCLLLSLYLIETKPVETAAQALGLIQTEQFALYLLDSRLPDLDGFELCRQMRTIDPHTPILFFSAAAYEKDKQKGLDAGANAYLSKPDIEGLLENVRQFVFPAQRAVAMVAA